MNKMQKCLSFLLLFALLFTAVSCGQVGPESPETVRETEKETGTEQNPPPGPDFTELTFAPSAAPLIYQGEVSDGSYPVTPDAWQCVFSDLSTLKQEVQDLKGQNRKVQLVLPLNLDLGKRNKPDSFASKHPEWILTRSGNVRSYFDDRALMLPCREYADLYLETLIPVLTEVSPDSLVLDAVLFPSGEILNRAFFAEWENRFGEPFPEENRQQATAILCAGLAGDFTRQVVSALKEQLPDTPIYLGFGRQDYGNNYAQYIGTGSAESGISGILSPVSMTDMLRRTRDEQAHLGALYEYALCAFHLNYAGMEKGQQIAQILYGSTNANYSDSYRMDAYRSIFGAMLQVGQISSFAVSSPLDELYSMHSASAREFSNLLQLYREVANYPAVVQTSNPGIGILLPDGIRDSGKGNPSGTLALSRGVLFAFLKKGIVPRILTSSSLDGPESLEGVRVLWMLSDARLLGADALAVLKTYAENGGTLVHAGDNLARSLAALCASMEKTVQVNDSPLSLEAALTLQGTRAYSSNNPPSFVLDPESALGCVTLEGEDWTPLIECGDRALVSALDIGAGRVMAVGLGPSLLLDRQGATFVLELTQNILGEKGIRMETPGVLVTTRGPYLIVHAFGSDYRVDRPVIDVLNPYHPYCSSYTVRAGESAVLMLTDSGQDPGAAEEENPVRVLFSSGFCREAVSKEDTFLCTFSSFEGESLTVSFGFDEDVTPGFVRCLSGGKETILLYQYNEAARVLSVEVPFVSGEETFEIQYGSGLSLAACPYEKKTKTVPVNNQNQDRDYLYFSNAGVNAALRYADKDTRIVYRFRTADFPNGSFGFELAQNYILEIGPNDSDYIQIADYSRGGTVEHTRTTANMTVLWITPDMYEGWEELFVRVRNCDITQGWGGTVSSIQMVYFIQK